MRSRPSSLNIARWIFLSVALAVLAAAAPSSASGQRPQVRLETTLGLVEIELLGDRAPKTVCNFLRYVRAQSFANGKFFRVVRRTDSSANPIPIDAVQAEAPQGSDYNELGTVKLEPTSQTGLSHRRGIVSMARGAPDSAASSFFIVVRDSQELDEGGRRNPDGRGFAAFGTVIRGMDIIDKIYQMPRKGELVIDPPMIRSAELVDQPPPCIGER